MNILDGYNLYLNNGDIFIIESMEEFERYVNLELSYFHSKEGLNLRPSSIEELREVIETVNSDNRDGIEFFLISKEDDNYKGADLL